MAISRLRPVAGGRGFVQRLRVLTRCCLLGAGLPTVATAAGLSVSPVSLQFQPGQVAEGLWLSNSGEMPLTAQLRGFEWSQRGGDEQLSPTRELAVSPPMFTIAPGQRQFVRVVRVAQPPTRLERSYRILVDELPTVGAEPRPGLNFMMRYSVPVFVDTPPGAAVAAQQLSWHIVQAGGAARLVTESRAARRAQLTDLQLLDDQGAVLFERQGLVGYVLAGAGRQWPFALDARTAGNAREIRVRVDGNMVKTALSAGALVSPDR